MDLRVYASQASADQFVKDALRWSQTEEKKSSVNILRAIARELEEKEAQTPEGKSALTSILIKGLRSSDPESVYIVLSNVEKARNVPFQMAVLDAIADLFQSLQGANHHALLTGPYKYRTVEDLQSECLNALTAHTERNKKIFSLVVRLLQQANPSVVREILKPEREEGFSIKTRRKAEVEFLVGLSKKQLEDEKFQPVIEEVGTRVELRAKRYFGFEPLFRMQGTVIYLDKEKRGHAHGVKRVENPRAKKLKKQLEGLSTAQRLAEAKKNLLHYLKKK